MRMSDKRILCVGLFCVDLVQVCKEYPVEDSDQRSVDCRWQRGGNASNTCTVLVKCDQSCEFFGTMSDDLMAKYGKEDFQNNGIFTKNVVQCSNATTPFSTVIANSKNGSRTIIHSNKNMPELTQEDFKKLDFEQYNWIHFEGRNVSQVALMIKHISDWNNMHNTKIRTSVELEKPREQLKVLLPLADVVFIGKDFALFQECKNKFETLDKNIKNVKSSATVIVAWGEAGAIGQITDGDIVESPAFPPKTVVDTLGAGDTFVAATILCLSRGCDLKQSLTTGCRVAGAKVGMTGFTGIHSGLLR